MKTEMYFPATLPCLTHQSPWSATLLICLESRSGAGQQTLPIIRTSWQFVGHADSSYCLIWINEAEFGPVSRLEKLWNAWVGTDGMQHREWIKLLHSSTAFKVGLVAALLAYQVTPPAVNCQLHQSKAGRLQPVICPGIHRHSIRKRQLR